MKLLSGTLIVILCVCAIGSGVASAADITADPTMLDSQWTVEKASCQPLTLKTVEGLVQLAQIGKGEPHTAAWSPDGTMVALATGTGVHLFDGYTLELLAVLQSGYTMKIAWSQDSTLLALCVAASAGDEIQLWDVAAKEKRYGITQKRYVDDLYIDQQNNVLLVLGQQQMGTGQFGVLQYKAFLDHYNLKTGKNLAQSVGFAAEDQNLMKMSLSYNGGIVFGVGVEECYIWHAKGKLFYSAPVGFSMFAFSESSADLSVILDLMRPNSLQLIDRMAGKRTASVTLTKRVKEIALNEDTQELLLFTAKGYLVYDMETQKITADVSYYKNFGGTVFLSPDQSRVFQMYGAELRLVDLNAETQLGMQNGYEPRAEQVAISGSRLIAAKGSSYSDDTRLLLWDLDTLASLAVIKGKDCSDDITDIFFAPDETEFLTYNWGDTLVSVWNASDGTKTRDIALEAALYSANLSADGSTIAMGHGGYAGVLPYAGTGTENTFSVDSYVNSISLNEAGSKIAACDGTYLVVWDAIAQKELFYIGDDALVTSVLHDGGNMVAALYSGQDNNIVKMLDARTGKIMWTHKITDNYCEMQFSPDGSMLIISAYEDGLIFLNAETGQEVFTLQYDISDFSYSEDGCILATASSDGSIRLWGVPQE